MKLRTHIWHLVGVGAICLTVVLLSLRQGMQSAVERPSSELMVKGFKPGNSYFTLYYKSDPVGDVETRKAVGETGVFLYDVITRFRLNAFGQALEIEMELHAEFDQQFGLSKLNFQMNSGDTSVSGHGVVEGEQLIVSVLTGGGKSTYTLPYDRNLIIGSVLGSRVTADGLVPGDVRQLKLFDPLSQTVRKVKLTAIGYEDVLVLDRRVSTLKIRQETMGVVLNGWVTPKGEMIRQELGMGLVAQLEPRTTVNFRKKRTARRVDLVQELLVPVTGLPHDYNHRDSLSYRLKNVPVSMRLNLGTHQIWHDDTVRVRRVTSPSGIPFNVSQQPLPSDDMFAQSLEPKVRSIALEMCGESRTMGELLKRTLDWFNTQIRQVPVASLPSSLETLRTRSGDCNEHAFLVAGMLRSLGVETHIITGIAYVPRLKRFGYHAWNEVRIDGEMVPIDVTWQQFPADVTHIGFVRGGLQAQSSLWSLMGRLNIDVVGVH